MTAHEIEQMDVITAEQVDVEPMEESANALIHQAKNLIVKTAGDVSQADQILLALASGIATTREALRPMRDSTTRAWKAGTELESRLIGPLEEAKKSLSHRRGAAVKEINDAAEAMARAEADRLRKEADDRALAAAVEAKRISDAAEAKSRTEREEAEALRAQGRDVEADMKIEAAQSSARTAEVEQAKAEAILAAPIAVQAPSVKEFSAPKTAGVSSRETWSAEVFDFRALITAAAANPEQYMGYLQINESALNGVARALKAQMSIPGCRARVEYTTATRGK